MSKHSTFTGPTGDTFLVWANNADTVGMRTEWAHNRPPEGVSETVTLFGVEYSVNVFLYRNLDGIPANERWRYAEVDGWWYDTTYTIRRKDTFDYGTSAAKKALVTKVIKPLAAWLNSSEGAAFTAAGDADDREDVLRSINKKLEVCSEVERKLLLIKAAIMNGRPVSGDEKSFARYGDIEPFDAYVAGRKR